MTAEAKRIFEQALALPEDQRADLIDALADSLQDTREALSPEWTTEISRRISAVSRGESKLVPGDEVEARIRRALNRL
ncbi:MAG: addiction module protein [Myxococcales bacterium]|nr:addiction module protein [Myxococcales bacterium]